MVTIDHIAKSSGFSRTTVAEILRNKRGYNAVTRQRVLQVAADLDYKPNFLGKALAGGRSMTIGLLVSSIDQPSEITTVRAIETSARECGWLTFLLGWEQDDDAALCAQVQGLAARRVDGIILYRTRPLSETVLKQLDACGVPIVFVGWTPSGAHHVVRDERREAIDRLAEHLASLGHRRAAYLHSQFDAIYPDRRLKHFQEAMAAQQISLDISERWFLPPGVDYELASYELVAKAPWDADAPSAILAHNDMSARGVMTALRERGLRVPDDVAVVGFGDLPQARAGKPELTTIHQPSERVGQAAFKLLHKLIEGHSDPSGRNHVAIPCDLVIRGSTGAGRRGLA